MYKAQRCIEVFTHWEGLSQPVLAGILNATLSRGKEIFSFEYNSDWLKSKYAQALDPSLQLLQGIHYAPQGQENFGVFVVKPFFIGHKP